MPRATLTHRVEVLEHTVSDLATTLPPRMSALERELADFRDDVRREFAGVKREFANVQREFVDVRSELRAEIRAGDEDTRRYMRVLYEDLVDRIKTIGEGVDELRGR